MVGKAYDVLPQGTLEIKLKHEKHRRNIGANNGEFRTFGIVTNSGLTVNNDEKDLMLCNIVEDPSETTDVSKQHPKVVEQMLKQYSEWWDACRPLMVNEDADLSKTERPWPDYLKEQTENKPVPELIIPGVQTDLKIMSMSVTK